MGTARGEAPEAATAPSPPLTQRLRELHRIAVRLLNRESAGAYTGNFLIGETVINDK